MGNVLQLSPAGLDFLCGWETFSASVYPDQGGRDTIGYGHLIRPGRPLSPPAPWTHAQALSQLRFDAMQAEGYVNALVMPHIGLAQHEFDAVTCLVENIGGPAFQGSHLLSYLRAGARATAAEQFLRWDHVNGVVSEGLLRRRANERAMFLGLPYQAHA
jgi:lysozyme